ncbi:MAG: MoaD/ThiS family protein [Propionivibrio sp.]|uniref:MoaD/ThiS family protein n=1 Tax=Candidatus Propionivibrio dominans TaxID=2954373 RepID=A0A9D7I7H2_9RHOO|nr:MoaD/ThiS family protein [Candidatus Propionivibrio dominans]MBL0166100.1 MoaD/ThiS family protein [Propionivibrio sp.]
MITVLFFGPVAERVGASRLEVEFHSGMRLQDVQAHLQPRYPEAFALVTLAAVNGEHVRDRSLPLADNSEVVFMSKFSGG